MPKLSDTSIKAAKCPPGKDRVSIVDSSCQGLVLRVTKSGSKSFAFVYWSPLMNKTVTVTLGKYPDLTYAKARTDADAKRALITEDKDPRAEKRKERRQFAKGEDISFEDLCQRYMDEYAIPTKSSWKNDEGYLKPVRAALGWMLAKDVTDDDIADVLDEIADGAPVSANRTQSVLHKMFEWAKQPGRKYVPKNPIQGLARRGGKEITRDRVLDDDEIKTLWWGLDDPELPADRQTALALKMILTTMVRPYQAAYARTDELLNFKKQDPQYLMPKERVKGRREVIVPLSDLAVSVISQSIKSKEQKVVFPSRYGANNDSILRASLSRALNDKKSEKRIGIRTFLKMEHFTPHDLRRTAATVARRGKAPRPDVKALLDHIEGDVTDIYDKYDMLDEKTAVTQILGTELRRIIGKKK